MQYIDTHAHYNDEIYVDKVDEVLEKCQKAGVNAIINIGYDLPSSIDAINLSNKYFLSSSSWLCTLSMPIFSKYLIASPNPRTPEIFIVPASRRKGNSLYSVVLSLSKRLFIPPP